jgi:Zn-dependent peptidase ImmA (M78 family)
MFELVLKMRHRLKDIQIMLPRSFEDPVTSARLTRSSLGLSPDTPIADITTTFERAGVLILRLPIEVEGLDGFSAWVGPTQNIPVICLLKPKPGYRERLTISEEAGHLAMHTPLRIPVDEAEKEAKAFAGEFLFPEETMRRELVPPITLSSLAQSKHRWRASLNFQVVQSYRIGLITQNQYRYLMQQLSIKGWRLTEEGDSEIALEAPRAFLKMAGLIYGSPIDLDRIRKEIGIPLDLLRVIFQGAAYKTESGAGLRVVKREEKLLA